MSAQNRDLSFKKSTHSPVAGGVWCVEVQRTDDAVLLQDSKNKGVVQTYSHDEWNAFIKGAKEGQFDL